MQLLECYTARELADEFGITPRMIYRYRQMKLLSPTLPRSPYTFNGVYKAYGPQHIRELRKIMEWKEQIPTLADMRERLHPVEDAQ